MHNEAPATETEGPTINGHPTVRTENVQAWFESEGFDVSSEIAFPIAALLNNYELLGFIWKDTREHREWRSNDVIRRQHIHAAVSLDTLGTALPHLIEHYRTTLPEERHELLRPLITLLDQVQAMAPGFKPYLPRRGRKTEHWHIVARKVGAEIVRALKICSDRDFGLGQPTSPAIRILGSALVYLGVHKAPESVVDAARPKRNRR
jgi:hypothetical protein